MIKRGRAAQAKRTECSERWDVMMISTAEYPTVDPHTIVNFPRNELIGKFEKFAGSRPANLPKTRLRRHVAGLVPAKGDFSNCRSFGPRWE